MLLNRDVIDLHLQSSDDSDMILKHRERGEGRRVRKKSFLANFLSILLEQLPASTTSHSILIFALVRPGHWLHHSPRDDLGLMGRRKETHRMPTSVGNATLILARTSP